MTLYKPGRPLRHNGPGSDRGYRRAGFTLIEMWFMLLVVLILAGLLSGAAQQGYRIALSTKSAGNLHALVLANLLYASDHKGQFCPAQEPRNLKRWHGARTGTSAPFDPTKGYLYPYLVDGGKALVCPVFKRYPQSSQTFERGSGGYGYNEMYIGGTPKSQFIAEKAANVKNPAHTIMFTDTCLPRGDGIQEYPFSEPYMAVNPNGSLSGAMSPSVHFRHQGYTHVAWCDGSVTAELPTRYGGVNLYGGNARLYQVGWLGPVTNNGWWNSRQTSSR